MLIAIRERAGEARGVRLDLAADTEDERAQLEAFVTALAGQKVSAQDLGPLKEALATRLRLSTVGFDAEGRLMSLAIDCP